MTTGDFDPNIPYGQPQGYPNMRYGQPGSYPPAQPPVRGQAPGGLGYPPVSGQKPGGLGVRFLARLIDFILVATVPLLLSVILGDSDPKSSIVAGGLVSGLLPFVYFVVLEITQGWTPGKKLFRLSVHGPAGAPKPNFKQSAIRNSFTLLSIIPYIGVLLAFAAWSVIAVTINSSPTKQGKHDELAGGTQVVKG